MFACCQQLLYMRQADSPYNLRHKSPAQRAEIRRNSSPVARTREKVTPGPAGQGHIPSNMNMGPTHSS
eukprot:scaffold104707_cov33-Tisochrysis_lutea.AAC.1